MAGDYTEREVAWLLSMTHADALKLDTTPRDSWPDLLSSEAHLGHAGAGDPAGDVLVVLRWSDVQRARRQIQGPLDERIGQLRRAGFSQEEIGEALGRSQQTVSRHWRATIEEILAVLHSLA